MQVALELSEENMWYVPLPLGRIVPPTMRCRRWVGVGVLLVDHGLVVCPHRLECRTSQECALPPSGVRMLPGDRGNKNTTLIAALSGGRSRSFGDDRLIAEHTLDSRLSSLGC